MSRRLRLDLPLLLPDVPNARDHCVERLQEMLQENAGIVRTHVRDVELPQAATLCVHYDPSIVPPAQVETLARAAGAAVSERYGHAVLPVRPLAGEDTALILERSLQIIPGVLTASVSLLAQRARVEYDRRVVGLEDIREEIGRVGRTLTEAVSEDG